MSTRSTESDANGKPHSVPGKHEDSAQGVALPPDADAVTLNEGKDVPSSAPGVPSEHEGRLPDLGPPTEAGAAILNEANGEPHSVSSVTGKHDGSVGLPPEADAAILSKETDKPSSTPGVPGENTRGITEFTFPPEAVATILNRERVIRNGLNEMNKNQPFVDIWESFNAVVGYMAATRCVIEPLLRQNPAVKSKTQTNAAKKCFETPEILEHIFLNLTPRELLIGERVNRQFRETMASSTAIQRSMSLAPSRHLKLIDDEFKLPGFQFAVAHPMSGLGMGNALHPNVEGGYSFTSSHSGPHRSYISRHIAVKMRSGDGKLTDRLQHGGPRARSMLICSPPILTMNVVTECCRSAPDQEVGFPPITNEEGIKLGDIFDVSLKLFEKHKLCYAAHPRAHRSDGTVDVTVTFTGQIELRDDDPAISAAQKETVEVSARQKERRAHAALMEEYIGMKQEFHAQGDPMPTLEQYKGLCATVDAQMAARGASDADGNGDTENGDDESDEETEDPIDNEEEEVRRMVTEGGYLDMTDYQLDFLAKLNGTGAPLG